jgi:phage gp16-like protein
MGDPRKRQLAAIHLSKAKLGLDDDTYRDLVERVTGKRSSADLDDAGRAKVLDSMARLGGAEVSTSKKTKGRPTNIKGSPQLRKVEALLAEAKRPWSYADAILKRMCGVERCQFADPTQLHDLITALMQDAKRHGRRTS